MNIGKFEETAIIYPEFFSEYNCKFPKSKFFRTSGAKFSALKEINKSCVQRLELFKKKIDEARRILRKDVKQTVTINCGKHQERKQTSFRIVDRRLNEEFAKLSERQDRPLRNGSVDNVVKLNGTELRKLADKKVEFLLYCRTTLTVNCEVEYSANGT